MNYSKAISMFGLAGLVLAGTAGAVDVGNPTPGVQADDLIDVDTTWTADNTYNLRDQIYVVNGATLTIEAGTVIASTPSANGSGSLAITRGSKIIAKGTCDNPIIFTSLNDVATWDADGSHPTGGDPKTGTWREAANEWGNLTIMGRAYISENAVPGNSATCDADNRGVMEGLVAQSADDPNVLYGGGDDDDNSGCLEYVSIRYGGRVIGLGDELNGLSLGGIGRGTDINHIEIMNNVDDGIEIWGGTVNLKYFNVWNIGDDSLDIDQGYRGKIQHGLIVQGFSLDASQGSGVGDNCIETDGAEDSFFQPRTRATIYNVTVLGQPADGDGGTAWRDNAGIQYRKCIWMDLGEQLVRPDGDDGDGAAGYGASGTRSFAQHWTTPYSTFPQVNACANPAARYQAQSQGDAGFGQGFWAEITDSVFSRNLAPNAYTEAIARGVVSGTAANPQSNPGKANVVITSPDDADQPIVSVTRQTNDADGDGLPGVTRGGKIMFRVLSIDPRAANEATSCMTGTPNDGFFDATDYRGGFGTGNDANWLCNWTATDAFDFIDGPCTACPVEPACPADIAEGDDVVNVFDLLALLGSWGDDGPGADIADPTDIVDVFDLLDLLAAWGSCPE